jgi:hypothetical protein
MVTTRAYRSLDEFGITTLFLSSDPKRARSVHFWNWSNKDRWNKNYVSQISEKDQRIVGHYSFGGLPVTRGHRQYIAGFGQQAVIHPDFRNLATLVDLYQNLYKRARSQYDFLFGFPNDHIFPIMTSLFGWKKIASFHADIIQMDAVEFSPKKEIIVKECHYFPEFQCLNQTEHYEISKHPPFLNWRIFSHPINHYAVLGAFKDTDPVGYLIVKLFQGEKTLVGHLIGYETKNHDLGILETLLANAKGFFAFYHVTRIIFWNFKKPYEAFLKSFCSGEKGFPTNFGIHTLNPDIDDTILDLDNWSLSMIDSDAF